MPDWIFVVGSKIVTVSTFLASLATIAVGIVAVYGAFRWRRMATERAAIPDVRKYWSLVVQYHSEFLARRRQLVRELEKSLDNDAHTLEQAEIFERLKEYKAHIERLNQAAGEANLYLSKAVRLEAGDYYKEFVDFMSAVASTTKEIDRRDFEAARKWLTFLGTMNESLTMYYANSIAQVQKALGLDVSEAWWSSKSTGKLVGNREARWCGTEEEKKMWEYHMKLNKDKDFPKISEYSYLESEGMLGCMAGTYHMFIENDGTVTPCDMIPLSFGNVKEEGFETAYSTMAERYKVPRYECFVRAAHALFKKGFDREGKFPLSVDTAMEITGKVRNRRMPEFFKKLGMPPPVFDDEKPVKHLKEKMDLTGLECPEPVWRTQEKIWDMKGGVLEILVNEEEARDNVEKTAESEGWSSKVKSQGNGEYLLVLSKR